MLEAMIALVVLSVAVYFVLKALSQPVDVPPETRPGPVQTEGHDDAVKELQERLASFKRKQEDVGAIIDEDPTRAAHTVSRIMKH